MTISKVRVLMSVLFAVVVATMAHAGISVSAPDYAPGWFTIYYGLGTPAPGKIAYVRVVKPDGTDYTVAQAENVSDYSQVCWVEGDIPGTYRFYYEFSFESQGIPRTTYYYQDYTIDQRPRDIEWGSVAPTASIGAPGQNVGINIPFTNTGGYDYNSNYWIEVKDYNQTVVYYCNIGGVNVGDPGSAYASVTLPNLGNAGTAVYHLSALEGGVTYFGSVYNVGIVSDYTPSTNLSVQATIVTINAPIRVTSVTSDGSGNLINQAIDYARPNGSWISGSTGAGTRWEGLATGSNTLTVSIIADTLGAWQVRARGQDSNGQLSSMQTLTVNVASAPTVTLSLDSASLQSPATTTARSTAGPSGQIVYHGVEGRMTWPTSGTWQNWGIWNDSGGLPQSTAVGPTTAGNYEVRAYAARADELSSYSSSVTLTVNSSVQAPTFTTSPMNQAVTAGSAATFTVAASGNPSPTYQWQRKPAGGSFSNLANGGSYSGATSSQLTVSNTTTAMSGDQFQCVATNSAGSATSNAATLTVNPPPVSPPVVTGGNAAGTVGVAFSYYISASNGPTGYGASPLPAGLNINNSTGQIYGTPTAAGTTSVTISATNAGGTGGATLIITIASDRTDDTSNQNQLNIHLPITP